MLSTIATFDQKVTQERLDEMTQVCSSLTKVLISNPTLFMQHC